MGGAVCVAGSTGVLVTTEGLLRRGRVCRGPALHPGLEQPEVSGDWDLDSLMTEAHRLLLGSALVAWLSAL